MINELSSIVDTLHFSANQHHVVSLIWIFRNINVIALL